jgi:hypothetical protein
MVKCHSNRLLSRGAAVRAGSGHRDNSRDSCMMRLMLGDLELNVGLAIVGEMVG